MARSRGYRDFIKRNEESTLKITNMCIERYNTIAKTPFFMKKSPIEKYSYYSYPFFMLK